MSGSLDDIRKKLSGESPKCEKIKYENKLAARKALLLHWKKRVFSGSIYYCESCEGFHLTKRKPGKGNFRFR